MKVAVRARSVAWLTQSLFLIATCIAFLHIYTKPLTAISFTDEVRFLGKAISREINSLRTPTGKKIRSFNLTPGSAGPLVEDPSQELLTVSCEILGSFLVRSGKYRQRTDTPEIIINLSLKSSDEGLWLTASLVEPSTGLLRAITAREITWNETVHSMISLRHPLLEFKRGGQLVAVYDVRYGTIDPAILTTDDERRISLNLFEPLFDFSGNGALTESVSHDDQVCTITLRNGTIFTDGSPLTAPDVAGSLRRSQSLSTAATVSYFNSLQPRFSCPNFLTLVITLVDSCPPLTRLLSLPEFGIVKFDTVTGVLLGSGPFRQISSSSGQLAFRSTGDTRALLSEITIIPASQAGDAALLFDIDDAGQIPLTPELYRKYKNNPSVDLIRKRGTRIDYLLVANPNYRQIIAAAIDREALCKVVLAGMAENNGIPLLPAAPDTAVTIEPPNLTLAYCREQLPDGAVIHKLQTDFKRNGLNVALQELPETEFMAALKISTADIYYLTWSSFQPDPFFFNLDFRQMTGRDPDAGTIIELFQIPAIAAQSQTINLLGRDHYADDWKNMWRE